MYDLFKEDFLAIGKKADALRQKLWGKKVFYINNLHINYTDICVSKCRFCAFAKDEGNPKATFMDVDDAVKYVSENAPNASELHIVGGLHPSKKFNYYTDMIRGLKTAFPDKTIKAFSAVEIDYFSSISSLSLTDVLQAFKNAGLEMMPGGGAEIFEPSIRKEICPEKIPAERWLEVHEKAHNEGILTNATMLYGHLESTTDRMRHLETIRNLQEKTKGFLAFIPLSFHPQNTFLSHLKPSTGINDLMTIAVSRLVLDNIPHIKAYWIMLGEKTAQIALRFGADDLDGTIIKENITHAAGAESSFGLTENELEKMIISAGLEPVKRDAFYRVIS